MRRIYISFIVALILSAFFGLFLSGTIGWFFFTCLILLPVVSYAVGAAVKNKIIVSAYTDNLRVYKNEKINLTVTIENSSILPSPPVEIVLSENSALECGAKDLHREISVMPKQSDNICVSYTAKMWYPTYIEIERIKIKDYIGLFSFDIANDVKMKFEVDIIPDIAEVPAAGEIIRSIGSISGDDDSEESSEIRSMSFTGNPGFEHREYVPGDPIKRINWKISCKRDELLVRLDEEIISARHTFVLDKINSSADPLMGEICGEYMLGVLSASIRTGISAEVWFFKNEWQCMEAESENDLENLRLALAGYRFSEIERHVRIPYAQMENKSSKKISAVVFFSPSFDKFASSEIKPMYAESKTDSTVIAAVASVKKGVDASGAWLISKDGNADLIR